MYCKEKVKLHLNLKSKFFKMIESGKKKEEYREIKPYWERVFKANGIKIKGFVHSPDNVVIVFSNGYSKNRKQMFFTIKEVVKGRGKKEWGADPNRDYFVIKLKERVK